MHRRILVAVSAVTLTLAGCGGASSPGAPPGLRTPPDLAAFLRQPVATPSACADQPAASNGRSSPWVGHVDISVFLKRTAPSKAVRRLGARLKDAPSVEHVYFESSAEAYAEFQRLYTCWAEVPRSQAPASYRIVLLPTATIAQRNSLVARALRDESVDTASCDPSLPCTDVVRSQRP